MNYQGQWSIMPAGLNFAEIVVNDGYFGVFVLMEKLKRGKNRVDLNKFKEEEIHNPTAGGYFFKIDSYWNKEWGWLSNMYEEGDRIWQTDYQCLYPKPEDISEEQKSFLKAFMNNIDEGFFYPDPSGLKKPL